MLTISSSHLVPSLPPTNVSASTLESPYTTVITWKEIPFINWEGNPLGYRIYYEKISTGEEAELEYIIRTLDVGVVNSTVLSGLEVYARYRIRVAARTKIGPGKNSSYAFFGKKLLTKILKAVINIVSKIFAFTIHHFKALFSDESPRNQEITLLDGDKILSDDHEVSESQNTFLRDAV